MVLFILLRSQSIPYSNQPTSASPINQPTLADSDTNALALANIPIIAWQQETYPTPRIKINSQFITTTPPVIDGLMNPGEWGQPCFTKIFKYRISEVEKDGELRGFFMNDYGSIFAAVTVKTEDFNESVFAKESISLCVDLHFDAENDGKIKEKADIRRVFHFLYQDCYLNEYNGPSSQENQSGKGVGAFDSSTNTYNYEFQIPLESGEPTDFSVKAGGTIGIKVMLSQYKGTTDKIVRLAIAGWPTAWYLDEKSYAELVLATH
jgi:hypothetical protein